MASMLRGGVATHLLFSMLSLYSLAPAWARSNLDAREPIVRSSPAQRDEFGFAVVLHQLVEPVPGDMESFLDSTRLIVGAPKGTYPGGLSGLPLLDPVNRTGLVYQCPVTAGGCDGLLSDDNSTDNNDRRLFDGDPNGLTPDEFMAPEIKEDQLMGSVLVSTGDLFVACAPRWVIHPDNSGDVDRRRPVGRCFVSGQALQNFSLISPCTGRSNLNPTIPTNGDQCFTGFAASITTSADDEVRVVLSRVGQNNFNGDLNFYNASVVPPEEYAATTPFMNRAVATNLFEGYSIAAGFITNQNQQDVISGVPRFNGDDLVGGVRVRSQDGDFVLPTVVGFQTGEYFGYAVATADLNNDGYDEVIVGGPMYSTNTLQEIGRVYVYENTGGNLTGSPIVLTGSSSPPARFGTSIVNLGDINGDNFEDIAVGAPYEVNPSSNDTGAVYIYYGASSDMGLISRSPDQVILARDIVEAVPEVSPLRTFGFSLASGVDVDGNLYNDLSIGAYESGTAVLIRSLSVAAVTVDLSTNVDMITFDTIGSDGSMFVLTVCASYSGRGLDGRSLNASVQVFEIVSNSAHRLYFERDRIAQTNTVEEFYFNSTDMTTCIDVDVFVKSVEQLPIGQVDLLSPLQVSVNFLPISRPVPTFSNGDPVILSDYRDIPVLLVEGNTTTSVIPTVNCSLDENMQEICRPDLTVTLLNISYMDSQDNPVGMEAVALLVETLHIALSFENIGDEPAFGSTITFSVPERFGFVRAVVPAGDPSINCRAQDMSTNYTCDLPNYIPPGNNANRLTLIWRVTSQFRGDEPDDIAPVSILLTSTRDEETDVTNNDLINGPLRIVYSAQANLVITSFIMSFQQNPATYRGVAPESDTPTVDEIGERVLLTLATRNRGPSNAPGVTLDIFIPTNDTENSFYLYLFDLATAGSSAVQCDNSLINPQGLPSSSSNRRRKRFARMLPRQADPVPQVMNQIRNCSSAVGRASYCSRVRCTIPNFLQFDTTTITITAALDERFFQSQTGNFTFVGYANISSNEPFVEDDNVTNNQRSTPDYLVTRFIEPEDSDFPLWIPIVCGIVAIILIVLLFVLLYCVGFFRRKKREHEKDDDAEGDFVPPVPVEQPLPPEEDEKLKDEDIGGTEDLQDGELKEKPEVDPEETSL